MDKRRLGISLISAGALSTGAAAAATAAIDTRAPDQSVEVNEFGIVTLGGLDIGSLLTEAELGIGEMYAGNNCYCSNSGCGPNIV